MTRNLSPGGPPDGGIITRPGRRSLHMPRVPRPDLAGPASTRTRNERAVETDPALGRIVGDLSRVLAAMAPQVLQTEVLVLDAAGMATRQFRVKYRSLAITSESASTLTVSSSTPGVAAPGPGPGAARIPPKCFAVHNLAGNAWTIYGGAPGDIVTVTTFGTPQPAAAAKLG